MDRKWFWGTFLFWVALGISVGARGLIRSDPRPHFIPLARFDGSVDGRSHRHRIEFSKGSLQDCRTATRSDWRTEGWHSEPEGIDWAGLLLDLPEDWAPNTRPFQVQAYSRKGQRRFLVLWTTPGQGGTYRWWMEFPEGIGPGPGTGPSDPLFRPPPGTFDRHSGKLDKVRWIAWSSPAGNLPRNDLLGHFRSQGFHPSGVEPAHDGSLLLRKGPLRAVVTADPHDPVDRVLAVIFPSD